MTTIKIEKLLPVFGALQRLATVKMPVKAGYRIAKNLGLARAEVDTYERERIKIAEELSGGEKNEAGTEYKFSEDAKKEFSARHAELVAEDVDVAFVTLTPEDLGSAEIEPWILDTLDGVVIVESEQPQAS